MRLTPVQRERLKNSDFYIELPAVGSHVGKCLISLINQEIPRAQGRFEFERFMPEGRGIIFGNGVNVLYSAGWSVCGSKSAKLVSDLFHYIFQKGKK